MRYLDLRESLDEAGNPRKPALLDYMFNGGNWPNLLNFLQTETIYTNTSWKWMIMQAPGDETAFLAVGVDPQTLVATGLAVYKHGGEEYNDCEEVTVFKNLERFHADYGFIEYLKKVGVKEVDESVSEEAPLDEGYGKGWAILPATMALYGKKVVDIVTAASCWEDHETTILVCAKDENGRARTLFVASSGDASNHYKVGQSSETFHDQTGASKGVYTIKNIVVLKGGEILKSANNFGLNLKASLAVFK